MYTPEHKISPTEPSLWHSPIFRCFDRIVYGTAASCSSRLCSAQSCGMSFPPVHRHAVWIDGFIPLLHRSSRTFVRPSGLPSLPLRDGQAVLISWLVRSLHASQFSSLRHHPIRIALINSFSYESDNGFCRKFTDADNLASPRSRTARPLRWMWCIDEDYLKKSL